MQTSSKSAALDIETTGLDPEKNRVVAVAVDTGDSVHSVVSDDEPGLLAWLDDLIASLPADVHLVTWNGEEFDLPFLHRRFEVNSVPTALRIEPRNRKGKYGGWLFKARWGDHRHVDIAPSFRTIADDRSIRWSLKPVARALLKLNPVEVDRRGSSIEAMDVDSLRIYVESDATITRHLSDWLIDSGVPTSGH
jgi:DNA polymerase elongation subunit (family B)